MKKIIIFLCLVTALVAQKAIRRHGWQDAAIGQIQEAVPVDLNAYALNCNGEKDGSLRASSDNFLVLCAGEKRFRQHVDLLHWEEY